uniref:Secreted protein n=1 Tax=Setaria viridis TaxID=4556 RepID=A0A4V6D6U1_SETVI|nr:hypothetical protein SEVIR_8G245466v2 [Setaria viridis]
MCQKPASTVVFLVAECFFTALGTDVFCGVQYVCRVLLSKQCTRQTPRHSAYILFPVVL